MIYKGLNEEDASFLSTVAKEQAKIDAKRFDDESEELKEYRVSFSNIGLEQRSVLSTLADPIQVMGINLLHHTKLYKGDISGNCTSKVSLFYCCILPCTQAKSLYGSIKDWEKTWGTPHG